MIFASVDDGQITLSNHDDTTRAFPLNDEALKE